MPNIVQTAALLGISLHDDGLLAMHYKINIAQSALRGAGITERPEGFHCPAVKLVRSVQLLMKHNIKVPEEVTSERPAKTINDLPNELLGEIFAFTLDEIHDSIMYEDYMSERRGYMSLFDSPLVASRLLIEGQKIFGLNQLMRANVKSAFFAIMPKYQEQYDKGDFWLKSMRGLYREHYGHYVLGGNDLCEEISFCKSRYFIDTRLSDAALRDLVGSVILKLDLEHSPSTAEAKDFFLHADGDKLQLHSSQRRPPYFPQWLNTGKPRWPLSDLIPYLPHIKFAYITTTAVGPELEYFRDMKLSDSTATQLAHKLEEVEQLRLLQQILPGLECLMVSVDIEYSRFDRNSVAFAQTVGRKALEVVRSLPVKRKTMFSTRLNPWDWHTHTPTGFVQNETTGMTDEYIVRELLLRPTSRYEAIVISSA